MTWDRHARSLLAAAVFLLNPGCASPPRDVTGEHPKVKALREAVRQLHARHAAAEPRTEDDYDRYFISVAPTWSAGTTILRGKEPGAGFDYEITCSSDTLGSAKVATVVEVSTAGTRLTTADMHDYVWDHDRWTEEVELFRRLYPKEAAEIDRRIEQWAGWLGVGPSSRAGTAPAATAPDGSR